MPKRKVMEKMFNTRVEKLIAQFRFEELSQLDQDFVLKSITEQEYRAFQSIVSNVDALGAPQIPISIQASLKKELFNSNNSKNTTLSQLINFKVPFWLVALLGLLFFFAYNFMPSTMHPEQDTIIVQQDVEPHIIYKTDTIFKEVKTEPIVITKVVEKIVYVEKASQKPTTNSFADNLRSSTDLQGYSNRASFFSDVDISEITISKPQGRPVSQDEALMGILDDLEPSVSMK